MPKITNTAEEPITIATLFTAQPSGIEAQERRGQQELVKSSQLPAKINSPRLSELKVQTASELYEKLGIKINGVSGGDNLFLDAVLPDGWSLISTEHSMWNHLLDDRKRERGSIFYKAAFYDRDAFLNVSRRFNYSTYEACDSAGVIVPYHSQKHTHLATYVKDGGKLVQLIAVRDIDGSYDEGIEHGKLAKEWLTENKPDWEDYFAYWD